MAYTLWSQDVFTKGELSPYMYARATVNEYGNGLKTAQNVLTYPTGAAGKRFGTLYQSNLSATIDNLTYPDQLYFTTFQYLSECVYQLVITADDSSSSISIYLEGILVAIVTTNFNLSAYQVYNLSTTVIGSIFRMTYPGGPVNPPLDLTRTPNSPIAISDFGTSPLPNYFTMSGASLTPGQVLPVQFILTGGSPVIPATLPQIVTNITYFAMVLTSTTVAIYASAYDAKFNINAITITSAGTGAEIVILNTWSVSPTYFKNLPFFDFTGGTVAGSYDALTFTPSAATGIITITVSGSGYAPLTTADPITMQSIYIGGAFFAGGGSGRITAVASATSFTVAVQSPFVASVAVQGSLAILAEPAWSNTRGYPQVCSSYQSRAFFANTISLQNGIWGSAINDYADFGDLTTDPDDAISWLPTSDAMNYIKFIVPYRSLTVHTNTGIYSTPLSDVTAITPTNFTLQLQDSTPADVLQPVAIDNQVLVLSGNDAHQMLWDGINNAYTSDIVSIINEQTIRNPVDEVAYADLRRAGSRFVFIINENGSMAVFQTLLSQNVSGFIPQIMEQSYGNAKFIQAASSADGRVWFVVQRQIATAISGIAVTGFGANSLIATASNLSADIPTAITFTTTGTLPASNPQIAVNTYYWGIGIDANTIAVYLTQHDAMRGENAIAFTSAGTDTTVVPWPLTPIFTMEELTRKTFLDCAFQYGPQQGMPTDTVITGILFNAQNVKMAASVSEDQPGYFGFDAIGVNDEVVFEAHGSTVVIENAFIGFPINTIIEPMPLTIANGNSAKTTTLTKPKHIRSVRFMFNNTIGGTINGVPIALTPLEFNPIGEPPFPQRGIFEMSIMNGWDDFNNPTYTIFHNDPFDIQLLGVFYSVDI